MQNQNLVENSLKGEKPQRFNYTLNPYHETPKTFEKPRGPKLTIPDQSMSVKEILQRHTRGLRVPDQLVGYYDDDYDPLGLDGTNIETLDLSQKYDLLRSLQRKNRHHRSQLEKEENEKKLSDLKAQIAKELSQQNSETQHKDS